MPIDVTVQRAHTTVDILLWRAYGRPGNASDMVAATYAANPGLAALGPELPIGRLVVLPDLPPASSAGPAARKTVNLFGDV